MEVVDEIEYRIWNKEYGMMMENGFECIIGH
jgi:hypothetical protein